MASISRASNATKDGGQLGSEIKEGGFGRCRLATSTRLSECDDKQCGDQAMDKDKGKTNNICLRDSCQHKDGDPAHHWRGSGKKRHTSETPEWNKERGTVPNAVYSNSWRQVQMQVFYTSTPNPFNLG